VTKQSESFRKESDCFAKSARNDVNQVDEMKNEQYFVYIMSNPKNTVLYTGVTNDLKRRVYVHKIKIGNSFTKRYNVIKLVYYEATASRESAIAREKQIKGGSGQKKIDLINSMNPKWNDLYGKF
jgi:putative endonuclease